MLWFHVGVCILSGIAALAALYVACKKHNMWLLSMFVIYGFTTLVAIRETLLRL